VDRLIIFTAPVLLGAGALPAFGTVTPPAGGADRWNVIEHRTFGDDTMTIYTPPVITR
jgi:riboflavin biosynthesis pyrimidine reductase